MYVCIHCKRQWGNPDYGFAYELCYNCESDGRRALDAEELAYLNFELNAEK